MGTPPTGYLPKYILWYIELNRHHPIWLPQPQLNVVISVTTQCGSLSPLNVVISITTQCGYFYHHSMWLSLSPLNVVISITTIAGKFIFVPNFAIALHRMSYCLVACLKPKVALNMVENED